MKKIIVRTPDKIYKFFADCALFDTTLKIIKNHEIIAEFMNWDNWYYGKDETFGSDKMPC